jgi:competence protein ComEA
VKEKIFIFISNLVSKNFMVLIVISLMLGGVVGFVFANKRVNTGCVLAMQDNKEGVEVKKIIVDLSGAVENPGLYELDEGSRVGDLLSLGGTLGESSATWVSKNLNLSKKLEDSSKVYIPFEWENYTPGGNEILDTVKPAEKKSSSSSNSSSTSNTSTSSDNSAEGPADSTDTNDTSTKINVNTATSSELDTLPGIGPAFAERVIGNRPYKDYAEFESKSGLYKSTSASIKDLISF